ncbi:type II toxin-antitoxin system RelE/ParE family toxin [Rhodopseudomonas palustris]|uniref:type II toxin-antitoxin system RelE/ParE family toxin n=1 Tax=Rhodopseudomonas palustris TaxID=1076 RepID=UPI00115F6A72|nr:type II toxin-antitoxin system RelE/ParE family toxin [Rhodopseudomonas palustris]QDL98498.1 type II toxin-antitoxin system RelE/ParE family toxin [Rhodopseudomonas palustris]
MRLVFDDRALDDLEQIFNWIASDSPVNAKRVVGRLFSSAELLLSFPLMGRLGQDPGTLEWVVPRLPYILVYEVDETEQRVIVTAVLHCARDRKV